MKVIDMLDRIAKGEEIKFKIIETGEILNLTKDLHLFSITNNEPIEWLIDEEWLNYEVEVIEEDKKIEKLYIRDRANDILIGRSERISYATVSMVNKEIALKINEIIDKVNQGEDKDE